MRDLKSLSSAGGKNEQSPLLTLKKEMEEKSIALVLFPNLLENKKTSHLKSYILFRNKCSTQKKKKKVLKWVTEP